MMMIFMMMCSGVSLRCTVSVVSQAMKMSKVVLLMKMMIFEMRMIVMMLCRWCFFAMQAECCFSGDENVEGRVVDEDDDCLK